MKIKYDGKIYRVLQLTHFCIHLECEEENQRGEEVYITRDAVEHQLKYLGIGMNDSFIISYDIPLSKQVKDAKRTDD